MANEAPMNRGTWEHPLEEGWYEFISRPSSETALTHIARVSEVGNVYLPEGSTKHRHFWEAVERGEAYRLLRAATPDDPTMTVGSMTLDLVLTPEGREEVSFSTDGELSLVTQLGMLAMTQDTLLHTPEDYHDEDA